MGYDLVLPTPHAKQRDFIYSPAKRKVVVAGRRGGKTTGAALLASLGMLDGRRVLEAAPTQDQTEQFWEKCKRYFDSLIRTGAVYKNETRRLLKWNHKTDLHGRIRCKTAWDADSLRGDYADLLILDEYSLMKPDAWQKVGAPMLLDNDGDAVFIYTPMRRNHAYTLFVKAKTDETGRYKHWHFTSHDNPHLSTAALEEIVADMTEDDLAQEIMAQFLENEGAVFHKIGRALYTPFDEPADHEGHTKVMGVDWGKKQDYTAASVGCLECQRELELMRFKDIGYKIQRGRLKALAKKWGVEYWLVELNAMGEANFDELVEEGLPVAGWTMTAQSKPPLISNLALAIEEAQIGLVDDEMATAELESFAVRYSPTTNRPTYSAPEGVHDDTVIARALMARTVIDRETALL